MTGLRDVSHLIDVLSDVAHSKDNIDPSLIPSECRIANIDPNYVGPAKTALPSVIFEGELTITSKTYQIINPYYIPQANDRVIMMPVGRTYVIVGPISIGLDTGWDSTPTDFFALNVPHTMNGAKARLVGDTVYLYIDITLGVTVTVPANGDIANSILGTMAVGFRPSASAPNQPLISSDRNVMIAGCVAPGGGIFILSTVPGASLASGQRITLSGSYIL